MTFAPLPNGCYRLKLVLIVFLLSRTKGHRSVNIGLGKSERAWSHSA